MGPSLGRSARRGATSHRNRGVWIRPGLGALLAAVVSLSCLVLAGNPVSVEAQSYSAYADPQKPVVSFVLSDEQNVEEFRGEFGLGDEEVEEALAIVRSENRTLAREYTESELIVESNEELPAGEIADKIDASDYDERLRAAVAETKAGIEALLPEDRRADLGAWVDAKFAQEEREFSEAYSSSAYRTSGSRSRGVSCKVFATQYHGYTRNEVALPHRSLKDKGGYRVNIRRGNHRTKAPVKEVGPWNIKDNYWHSRAKRDMWDKLPRCTPEAQAAYFDNYNKGKDQYGRKVTNPAGVDLTPRVARRLGLGKYKNAWVHVRYPWVRR
jgi:hypothetical protein